MPFRANGCRPRRSLRLALALASALALALFTAACGDDDDDGGNGGGGGSGNSSGATSAVGDTIKFGTDPTYPPLEFKDGNDLTGAEVELMEAVAEDLGAKAEWTSGDFASLITSLEGKRFDVMAAGMFSNPKAAPNMLFVEYLDDPGFGVLFRADDAPSTDDPKDLCGLTIAVGKGTGVMDGDAPKMPALTKEPCAGNPPKALILPNEAGAQLAVQSGRADGFATSYMSLAHIAKTAGGGDTFKAVEYTDVVGKDIISVGTLKTDRKLANQIKASIQKLMDDGTYGEILTEYGIDHMALDKVTIVEAK